MHLKRNAISKLIQWKDSPERKPMVLKGARQVGKTWLMKEFGRNYYDKFAYFNFDEEDELKSIFEANKNPQRIIELLSMIGGEKIEPGKTLIIFDEIQECPEVSDNTLSASPSVAIARTELSPTFPFTLLGRQKSCCKHFFTNKRM